VKGGEEKGREWKGREGTSREGGGILDQKAISHDLN